MDVMIILGWMGSTLLALCGIPQAVMAVKQGHSNGISWSMLLMWHSGIICMMIYVLPTRDVPLISSYAVSVVTISVMLWYKCFPRENK